MAGVEKIKEQILQDAELKVREILENAELQSKDIINEAEQTAKVKTEEIYKKAQYDATEKKKIINSMIELEMRKNILATKQDVINSVFEAALKRLNDMDGSDYERIMTELVLSSIQTGEEEIIVSNNSKAKLSNEFISNINNKLIASGKKGDVKLSQEEAKISGGFIIKNKGIEINSSFESILKVNRDDIEPKVVELLF